MDKVPYPNIWAEFSGKDSRKSDKIVKYRIQDLPEDRFEDAVDHLTKFYLPDETVSKAVGKMNNEQDSSDEKRNSRFVPSAGGLENKDFVEDFHRFWREILQQKMSLLCLREESNEIVALNVIFIATKGDTLIDSVFRSYKSKDFADQYRIVRLINEKVTIFDKYNVDSYMSSIGLSVHPKYRGLGLGQKLLETR